MQISGDSRKQSGQWTSGWKDHAQFNWILLERAEKFISERYFTSANFSSGRFYTDRLPVDVFKHTIQLDPHEIVPFERISKSAENEWSRVRTGIDIGPAWTTHWFRLDVEIPRDWSGKHVHLLWNSGCEALIYSADGIPLQGLTGGSVHDYDHRWEFVVSKEVVPGNVRFFVEVAANGMFGSGSGDLIAPPDPKKTFCLEMAEIAVFSTSAWEFWIHFKMLFDIAKNLPENSSYVVDSKRLLAKIMDGVDVENPDSWPRMTKFMQEFLSNCPKVDNAHSVTAIGNCHIDTAWLWRYQETRRKCMRSWSSAIRYAKDYPGYVFCASQAQQYEWMKSDAPELYKEIKEAVKKGQFVFLGGSWIEMDCNIPSGESLVRQFLYGQRFFLKEFGAISNIFWLPDTFGYTAQLPQICRLAGMEYFMTQKLSWNLINKFPHHSFIWEGLDGSQLLTHFPPANTYSSNASVSDVFKTISDYQQRAVSKESLLLYGHGDGGGGPTREMIERLNIIQNTKFMTDVKFEHPELFFKRLSTRAKELPIWVGELYFELHRGTFTTQSRLKYLNRVSEQALRTSECWSAISHIFGLNFTYPTKEFEKIWQAVLLNQFHDVLPGSCIEDVVKDAVGIYESNLLLCEKLLDSALQSISANYIGFEKGLSNQLNFSSDFLCFNSCSWKRFDIVELPLLEFDGFSQISHDNRIIALSECPSIGIGRIILQNPFKDVTSGFEGQNLFLENQFVRYEFSKAGILLSARLIKETREFSKEFISGRANQFVLYEDLPLYWDAWDTEIYHLQKFRLIDQEIVECEFIETGPLRCSIKFSMQLTSKSKLSQIISLSCTSARLDFRTTVDWNENHKFLKVEFPLNIRSTDAAYEVPFGYVKRPTHFNTSIELAKFEVCGHRWADLSEFGCGFSLLNDSKYGYACHRNILRLSLLRSPKRPDPNADIGMHTFTYSILPHFEDNYFETFAAAYFLNSPIRVVKAKSHGSNLNGLSRIFSVDASNAIIDTIKISEDDPKCLIVRIFEAMGGQSKVNLRTAIPFEKAVVCDLLERGTPDISDLQIQECEGYFSVLFELNPFQVISVKLLAK